MHTWPIMGSAGGPGGSGAGEDEFIAVITFPATRLMNRIMVAITAL